MQMPKITISDAVFDHLKKHAIPFEDSPDDVLRRLLNLPLKLTLPTSTGRTKQEAFRQPILDALQALGGEAHKHQVLDEMEKTLVLTDADRAPDKTGRAAWRGKACWEASVMRRDGVLVTPRRGIWKLPATN